MTRPILEAVFWCLLAGALAIVVLLIRERQISTRLRGQVARLNADLRTREAEVQHLATVRLPALMDATQVGQDQRPALLSQELIGTTCGQSIKQITDLFTQSVETAQVRADQAAKAALKSSMRALQGLANEQQLAISGMQERHDNPDVLADLLQIDHTNSQFGRRAQAIAVLCGSWPGRQRAASALMDVVRGATSRIRDYRRIQVHSQVDVAIISRAVEPVVLTVAELLDNAARHSQPNTAVQVNLQPAHNGTAVVIDDAGVGLTDQEIRRATQLLSGRESVDIKHLGDPPQFGFAVIGVLAARYGFHVSVDTRSPYGGVRAVVFLPSALLTRLDEEEAVIAQPVPAPAPAPAPAPVLRPEPPSAAARPERSSGPASHPEPQPSPAAPLPSTPGGLPKRRRRQPAAENSAAPAQPEPAAPQLRSASDAAAVMGAFARGTRSGRSSSDQEGTS